MPAKKKESDNKPPAYKTCSNGHKNSLNAKACWVCGASMDTPKPTFTQVTNTTVIMAPPVPYIGIDVNIVVPGECEKYVGKRERCDEKDPLRTHMYIYT